MREGVLPFREILLATVALAAASAPLSAHDDGTQSVARSPLSQRARGAVAIVDAFHAALQRGDTRAAAAFLADDALIYEAGGVEHGKAEYVAKHLPADTEFSRAVSSVVTRRSAKADASFAWVASEGRSMGTFRGKAIHSITTETMILRRVGKGWKIVHIHWSSGTKR
jgi:ketosteroid isomerase-like protein